MSLDVSHARRWPSRMSASYILTLVVQLFLKLRVTMRCSPEQNHKLNAAFFTATEGMKRAVLYVRRSQKTHFRAHVPLRCLRPSSSYTIVICIHYLPTFTLSKADSSDDNVLRRVKIPSTTVPGGGCWYTGRGQYLMLRARGRKLPSPTHMPPSSLTHRRPHPYLLFSLYLTPSSPSCTCSGDD
ncbi:hypothetical protein ARMSODRAFT_967736 [Armillaria solidipes]|uniref:Uncharacterized protein n=1 Tax=Armillaria solidipes TaxID=1076256 RepID=A0A2H3AXA1_9AGAR|nr:hypothetical protein ARMSODRAFT_967736 [Armillaria solidipes]